MRFMCYLNWTEQGARAMKDAPKRYEASRAIVEKLGGRIVSAYVTTGQYDVALTLDMPNGDAMTQFVVSRCPHRATRAQRPSGHGRRRNSENSLPRHLKPRDSIVRIVLAETPLATGRARDPYPGA